MNYQRLFEKFADETGIGKCKFDYDYWKRIATNFAKWLVKEQHLVDKRKPQKVSFRNYTKKKSVSFTVKRKPTQLPSKEREG